MSDSTITPLDANRDVGLIDDSDFARADCPKTLTERGEGFQVVFTPFALQAIHAHGKSSMNAEICGVLVGQPLRDERGAYLLIRAAVEGDSAKNHAAQVTFTAKTWAHIQEVMDSKYPDDRIVGWYHTHPGFGIFLSGMDLFIQDNFFNLPWQVAFVYDPKNEEEGAFTWQAGVASPAKYLVRDDVAEFGGQAPSDAMEPDAPPAPIERSTPPPATEGDETSEPAGNAAPTEQDADADGAPQPPVDGPASAEAFAAAFPALTLDEFATRLLTLERRQRYSDAILGQRIETLERRNRWLLLALAFTITFSVAWSLVIAPRVVNTTPAPRAPVAPPVATTQPGGGMDQ